jgi:hypothetical protein
MRSRVFCVRNSCAKAQSVIVGVLEASNMQVRLRNRSNPGAQPPAGFRKKSAARAPTANN